MHLSQDLDMFHVDNESVDGGGAIWRVLKDGAKQCLRSLYTMMCDPWWNKFLQPTKRSCNIILDTIVIEVTQTFSVNVLN
jgi:hypothetical protein